MAAEQRYDSPPPTLTVNADDIPAEIKSLQQWLCWDWEFRDGRHTKPPLRTDGGGYASSTDPATWSSFDDALAVCLEQKLAGVGFAFTAADPYFFLDLDHCRDPESGQLDEWARAILWAFRQSYHEVSPSGTGIRIIGLGVLPGPRHTKPIAGREGAKVEMFDRGKYSTLTGHRCDGSPAGIADAQAALDALYAQLFPPVVEQPRRESTGGGGGDDEDRLIRARASRNGGEFVRLYDAGDTSGHGGDASAADLALCNHLAFWFGPDPVRIDRVFRRSGLARAKWDERHSGDGKTYGQMTIDRALAGQTEFYTPRVNLRIVEGGRGESPPDDEPNSSGDGDAGATPPPPARERPEIDAGDQNLERISALAWNALMKANDPPALFRLANTPVRIENTKGDAPPTAQPLDVDRLSNFLARAAIWSKTFKAGEVEGVKPASPPLRMIRDMLAEPAERLPLPPLQYITRTPVFGPDGTLETTPGYHPASQTYYAPPPGFLLPAVATTPTAKDVTEAKRLILDELLGDFPFVGEAERANAVAIIFDFYVRSMIEGPTPLRLIEAPMAGTGKGALADAIIRHATGSQVSVMPASSDAEEWRKTITTQLREAPAVVLIDNIVKPLDSGFLAAALTALYWKDRRLGSNDNIYVPVRCIWIATANNPVMSTEIARRTVRIRLDAKVDRPWRREGFRHEDIRGWVNGNRSRLVWAGLTLVRHWLAEGSPLGSVRLGSYERWSEVLGGILGTCGVDGFLGNLEEFYESADLEGATWRQFVQAWAEKFGESEVGVNDLFAVSATVDGFDFKGSERAQKTAFGMALNKQRDRVVGDFRIVNTRTVQRLKRWRLIQSRPGANPFDVVYQPAPSDVAEEVVPWTL